MSRSRRIAILTLPALVVADSLALLIAARKQNATSMTLWIAIASLVVTCAALVVAWLTWLRPMQSAPQASSKESENPKPLPATYKAKGGSVAYAAGSVTIHNTDSSPKRPKKRNA